MGDLSQLLSECASFVNTARLVAARALTHHSRVPPRPHWRPGQCLAELPACGAPLALLWVACSGSLLRVPAPGRPLGSRGEPLRIGC